MRENRKEGGGRSGEDIDEGARGEIGKERQEERKGENGRI